MSRLEELNKIAVKENCFRVEKIQRNLYVLFNYYEEYVNYKMNEGRCEIEDLRCITGTYQELIEIICQKK